MVHSVELASIVARLTVSHLEESTIIEGGKPVVVEHRMPGLVSLLREFATSGVGGGKNTATGFGPTTPLANDGRYVELYAKLAQDMKFACDELNVDTHGLQVEQRIIAWYSAVLESGQLDTYAARVEWLHEWGERIWRMLNPPVVREQRGKCPLCGKETAFLPGGRVVAALFIEFDAADVAATVKVTCHGCGIIAEGMDTVQLLESVAA